MGERLGRGRGWGREREGNEERNEDGKPGGNTDTSRIRRGGWKYFSTFKSFELRVWRKLGLNPTNNCKEYPPSPKPRSDLQPRLHLFPKLRT